MKDQRNQDLSRDQDQRGVQDRSEDQDQCEKGSSTSARGVSCWSLTSLFSAVAVKHFSGALNPECDAVSAKQGLVTR